MRSQGPGRRLATVWVLVEAGGASGGPRGDDALLDPGKPTRSSTAPEVRQGQWARSGAACPNSGFCLTAHKTAPTWDYNADSERVAHPDRSEAWGGWSHLVPCPQARCAQLWEQSKRRAQEGGLTSTGAHGAEGRALPRSPSDLLLQPRACEVASPRRAQSRHPYWASRRSCCGRQGTAPATGKPLRRHQQCTSIAGPTGWLKRLRSLRTVDGGRGCCWAPVPQPAARFFFGACKASQARGANTGLAFAFFSPTRISKHSPCQGMCFSAHGCRSAATCAAKAVGGPQWNGAMANPTAACLQLAEI